MNKRYYILSYDLAGATGADSAKYKLIETELQNLGWSKHLLFTAAQPMLKLPATCWQKYDATGQAQILLDAVKKKVTPIWGSTQMLIVEMASCAQYQLPAK